MSRHLIKNGDFLKADDPVIHSSNRAFRYGDGLFESVRILKGNACFLEDHLTRLGEGAKALEMRLHPALAMEQVDADIKKLIELNAIESGRMRITLYREGEGHYTPSTQETGFVIDMHPLEADRFEFNTRGLHLDIYPVMRKPVNDLAVHKTLNCALYIMASIWSKSKGLDDCLLQNDRGNIIESSNSNLFIVSNGVLYTPSLSDGCLGGIMRMQIVNLALASNMKVYECSLNPQNLLAADEVFLTNAISGIRWVAGYRTKRYAHRLSSELIDLLNNKVLN